jgi:hypothetical protein
MYLTLVVCVSGHAQGASNRGHPLIQAASNSASHSNLMGVLNIYAAKVGAPLAPRTTESNDQLSPP